MPPRCNDAGARQALRGRAAHPGALDAGGLRKDIDMDVIVAIALLTAMVILAMTRARRRYRANRIDQAPPAPSVLLSVLPDRTALVTVDVRSDASSPAVAELVDAAVRHAFGLASVENVEVRR